MHDLREALHEIQRLNQENINCMKNIYQCVKLN